MNQISALYHEHDRELIVALGIPIFDEPKGEEMNAMTLILIVLTAYNLTMLVMKVWGDKFPQPHARNLHANWLQGWRNTQEPQSRFWVQFAITFAIMMVLNLAGQTFAGFLVFVRLIVFCVGYRLAKQQIAQASTSQSAPATADE